MSSDPQQGLDGKPSADDAPATRAEDAEVEHRPSSAAAMAAETDETQDEAINPTGAKEGEQNNETGAAQLPPLITAAGAGDLDEVKQLLAGGGDAAEQDDVTGGLRRAKTFTSDPAGEKGV